MGRFQDKLTVMASRLVHAWRRYAEFIEGQERAHAIRLESEQMKPTWIMRSDVDEELSRCKGEIDFKTLSRFYPHGFEFRRRFIRERIRNEESFRLRIENELVGVFTHGDFFRPESRCRIEPDLLPDSLKESGESDDLHISTMGRVFVMKDLEGWLKEIGFSDFNIPNAKALMIDMGSRGAWVIIDPRPEVFSRPLAERLAQSLSLQSQGRALNRAHWSEVEL